MKKRLDPRRRARAAESSNVDDYDTLMRVGNTHTVTIYSDDRVGICGHDFGPFVTLHSRSGSRLIIRMGGYGFYAGRAALTPHEYARTEYWACEITNQDGNAYDVRVVGVIAPGNNKRLLRDWLATK